jgi:hypothetical protein
MADTAADTYLRDIRSRLDTLPIAPDPDSTAAGAAIAKRVEEWHTCDRCGALAMVAYITRTDPPRWLDLCGGDARWLLDGFTPAWVSTSGEEYLRD